MATATKEQQTETHTYYKAGKGDYELYNKTRHIEQTQWHIYN